MSAITDGTSNTVVFSEWVKGTGSARAGLNMVYNNGIPFPSANNYVPLVNYFSACRSSTTFSKLPAAITKGAFWFNHKNGQGGGYSAHHDAESERLRLFQ